MQRNLDHRIEVLVPVENARVRQEIHAILDSALADDTNAWILDADGEWMRVASGEAVEAALAPRDDDAPIAQARAPRRPRPACRIARPTPVETIPPVRVAVIDVGSNSVRLLVASVERSGQVRELDRDRVYLRLGDDAYRLGRIGAPQARRAGERRRAIRTTGPRCIGAERLETIVTAPGRQASNADELVDVLADATRAPVVVLTAEDEGRLAWEGAVAPIDHVRRAQSRWSISAAAPARSRSDRRRRAPDVGPLARRGRPSRDARVPRRHTRPTAQRPLASAEGRSHGCSPASSLPARTRRSPSAGTARAVGEGRRPAVRRARSSTRSPTGSSATVVNRSAPASTSRRRGIETLLGGTLVLAEVARRLDTKLEVGRGGLREGAARALARLESAAA